MKIAVRTTLSLMLAILPGLAGAQGADPGDDKTLIFAPGDPEYGGGDRASPRQPG